MAVVSTLRKDSVCVVTAEETGELLLLLSTRGCEAARLRDRCREVAEVDLCAIRAAIFLTWEGKARKASSCLCLLVLYYDKVQY